jgi:hypothetical protein
LQPVSRVTVCAIDTAADVAVGTLNVSAVTVTCAVTVITVTIGVALVPSFVVIAAHVRRAGSLT